MLTHGKGPKDVYVGAYPRWQRGHRRWVKCFTRAAWHKLSHRVSDDQMSFGF